MNDAELLAKAIAATAAAKKAIGEAIVALVSMEAVDGPTEGAIDYLYEAEEALDFGSRQLSREADPEHAV